MVDAPAREADRAFHILTLGCSKNRVDSDGMDHLLRTRGMTPAANPDDEGFRIALSDALGELPPDQRTVVHLRLWEDLKFEEIADLLSISLNTAASRYRYGIDKLRQRLRPLYDEIK